MVIKGSARSNPGELAFHLLREDTNETVRVLGFDGLASDNLRDALYELDGMGAGSRSRRTLYHASINTPVSEQLTEEQQRIARVRLALHCGLQSQPFAVVEHVKHGRQHTHIVWSRIDVETSKAISDSHNYRKHELVSRELERQFGHQPVRGVHTRDKETEPRPERGPTWGELRQAERSGFTVADAKRIVTECWRQTVTGQEFRKHLEDAGFTIAKGDRRDFVLVDRAGEIHSLSKRLMDVKAGQVRERMADIAAGELPDVAEIRRRLQVQPDAGPQMFTGTVERLRADDERLGPQRPRLSSYTRDIADAVWQLNKTMRGEMERTIVGGPGRRVEAVYEARIEPQRPPAFDPAYAREEAPARIEPSHRPPSVDPKYAREWVPSEPSQQAARPKREVPAPDAAESLREQLRRKQQERDRGPKL